MTLIKDIGFEDCLRLKDALQRYDNLESLVLSREETILLTKIYKVIISCETIHQCGIALKYVNRAFRVAPIFYIKLFEFLGKELEDRRNYCKLYTIDHRKVRGDND